jgi:hypothetical protein
MSIEQLTYNLQQLAKLKRQPLKENEDLKDISMSGGCYANTISGFKVSNKS